MTTNTARYSLELFSVEDDTYALRDATTGELVMMASGEAVYAAPLENAMWTAGTMNRAEARKSAPAPEPTPEPTPEPEKRNSMDIAQAQRRRIQVAQKRRETRESAQPNPAALLHVMAHSEPTFSVPSDSDDYSTEWRTSEPVVRPVEKVDYPRMAGKAIGSIGVLSGRLASIGRWLDALEDGSVSPEFAMRQLRQLQTEAHKYAEDIYEELSAR